MNSNHAVRPLLYPLLAFQLMALSQAAVVEFTIDSAQTQVTLSGRAAGLDIMEQGPGSLITSFEGTIVAEIFDGSLHFTGNSEIRGITNGEWSPKAFGESGTEPADFGARAGGGLISGTGALRSLLLDMESEAPLALAEEQFDANGLLFRFPDSSPSAFDYRVTVFLSTQSDRRLLSGYATNQLATAASLTTQGTIQRLHIPIVASIQFGLLEPEDSVLTLSGQLEATRELSVTEPLVMGPVRIVDRQLLLSWTGGSGQGLQIERSTDLETWILVAELPSLTIEWSTELGEGPAFYRVSE